MDQITAQVQQKAAAGVSIPLPPLALDTAGRIYVGSAPIDVVPGNESAVVVPPFGVTLSVSVQQSVVVSATSSSMAVSSSTALALPVSVASVSTLLKSSVTLPSSVPPAVYGSPAPRSTGRSPVVISSSSRLVFGGALAALPWILAF